MNEQAMMDIMQFRSRILKVDVDDAFIREVKKFYNKHYALDFGLDPESSVERAVEGLLNELKNISKGGLRKSLEWHRAEIVNYISFICSLIS